MNIKRALISTAAVGAMGFGGMLLTPAIAQTSDQGKRSVTMEQQTSAHPGDVRQLSLKVKDIDKKNHKVTFEAQVTPEANIEENGQPIKLDQLEKGDEVRASFVPGTGEVTKLQVTRHGDQSDQSGKSK